MSRQLLANLEAAFGYPGHDVDYLCNVGTASRLMYFEIPKVACSSIKRTLQLLENADDETLSIDVHDKSRSTLRGALSSGLSYEELFVTAHLFRFTFVRNPYARILSCYLEKILADESERRRHQKLLGFTQQHPVSFLEFLRAIDQKKESDRDIHWRSQSALINDRNIHYHFLGRFEYLDRDFRYLREITAIPQNHAVLLDISHHRTNAQSRLQEFFGIDELSLAQKIYRVDFLRYGYSFELPQT